MDSVAIASAAPHIVRAAVNEKQLFKTMKHLFSTSTTVLAELMQNSRRAGATYVEFTIDPETKFIKVVDDGSGLSDFGHLVHLCASGWDEDITLTDTPFGMGFFAVFFACEQVTIRSGGKRMTASLDDIQSKRALEVVVDDKPVTVGTVIEMSGVSDKLLTNQSGYGRHRHPTLNVEAAHQLVRYAKGFPIRVILNGSELDRPHALAAIKSELTTIGHIHLGGVHDDRPSLPTTHGGAYSSLFLQGLPIGHAHQCDGELAIIHLEPTAFTARMPDRTALYDHEAQLQKISQQVVELARRHLVAMKAALPAEDFVRRYFRNCADYGVKPLLNDVPFIPMNGCDRVAQVEMNSENTWHGVEYSSGVEFPTLITRHQLISGEVKVWLDAPSSVEDDLDAAPILKLMQRTDTLSYRDGGLDPGHWLYAVAPSCADLALKVTPINEKAKGDYSWNANCEVIVVDRVEVEVTSRIDPDFRLQHTVDHDWFLISKDDQSTDDICERDTICYVMAHDASPDHPVAAFSDYQDESEHFREEWEQDAKAKWDSLVSGLLGATLADVLSRTTRDVVATFNEQHEQQLALASVTGESYAGLTFRDLGDDKFWDAMLVALPEGRTEATILKAAFFEAAQQKKT